MRKLTTVTLLLIFLFTGALSVLALTITKNETRDIVGSYGAINSDSPYFPHTRIPHPNSGTSDGRIKTTDVDEYPGTGFEDFKQVRTVTIGVHDHDDTTVVAIFVHAADGNWTQVVSEYDISTDGSDSRCGETSTIYGLNRHPHNDSRCYDNHTFTLNRSTDAILLKFSCAQTSNACPRNDDIHNHISNITWEIEDPATPTQNPTATPIATRTPTLTPVATRTPTLTPMASTPTPTTAPPIACWTSCPIPSPSPGATSGSFTCINLGGQQLWRNPACPIDNDCTCDPTSTPTPTPAAVPWNPYCPI